MHRGFYGLIALAAALAAAAMAQEAGETRRGKYLRTDVKEAEERHVFTVELEKAPLSMPRLVFRKCGIVTIEEVRIYELLREVVRRNGGEGATEKGTIEYIPVPGGEYRGETSVREHRRDAGPLAGCELQVTGMAGGPMTIRTDDSGGYVDGAQRLLACFDDMGAKELKLDFSSEKYGTASIKLTRNLLRREAVASVVEPAEKAYDLLEALGLDFTQRRVSGVDGVRVKVTCPEMARRGAFFPMTVEVENKGPRPVSNLLARTFSADASMAGRLFYFGAVAPGGKASFTRFVKMPERSGGSCFVSIGFWSVLGKAPGLESRLEIRIQEPVEGGEAE